MSISKSFLVKSRISDYRVDFVNDFVATLKKQDNLRSFFIIDRNIQKLYRERLKNVLPENRTFAVQSTEFNKTFAYCHKLIELLIKNNIRKNSILVAIGGGIIQDITAFISTILFRGIDWVFYPTTLLAQADSCIGGKSSINIGDYKNLLGSFYPPQQIFIDVSFLDTLPVEEIKSGIGEILHFYFIAGSKRTKDIMANYEKLLTSPKMLKDYIFLSLRIKKKVIELDEFDRNIRNLFNYGHTFGHAIESISKYKVSHGQAVTMGMDIANFLSLNLDYLDKNTFEIMHQVLEKNLPDFCLAKNMIDTYLKSLSKDKKNLNNNLVCILTKGPGAMQKVQIPLDNKFKRILLSYFKKR